MVGSSGVARLGRTGLEEGARVVAEHPDLVDGLVRVGAAQTGRPIGRQHDERYSRVRRLDDRRVEVGHGRPRRGDHHDRRAAPPREAEREEPGGALVEMRVEPAARRAREGEHERGRP
jgi:hypothetical protein